MKIKEIYFSNMQRLKTSAISKSEMEDLIRPFFDSEDKDLDDSEEIDFDDKYHNDVYKIAEDIYSELSCMMPGKEKDFYIYTNGIRLLVMYKNKVIACEAAVYFDDYDCVMIFADCMAFTAKLLDSLLQDNRENTRQLLN